jgi:fido (protein-threonine AMPylation protein)
MGLVWEVEPPPTRDPAGAFRTSGVRVGGLRVSTPSAVAADLSAWSRSTTERTEHPVVHAAVHHARFEQIHPFVDGNGRVGRLALTFLLVQAGYPPAVLLKEHRGRYLDALRLADRGNPMPLAELVARSVSAALARFLIPNLAGNARLVPLAALVPEVRTRPVT